MKMVLMIALMFAAANAQAQELIEKNLAGASKATSPIDARREIQDQVAQDVTEELAKQILGEEKFLKNRSLILGKIAKNFGRYIPFVKPGNIETTPDGFRMSVAMKVSLPSLRQLLQENNLLNMNEAQPVILPLITVSDKVEMREDRWWAGAVPSAPPLRAWSRLMENSFRSAFQRNGFYLMRPLFSGLAEAVPKALQTVRPSPEDFSVWGDWFGSPLVLDGNVSVTRSKSSSQVYRLDVRMSVLQVSNNRPIGDVLRTYETDAGSLDAVVERKLKEVMDSMASDLASQVLEAWQKGSVGSSQLKLTLEQRMSLPEIEAFKEKIRGSSLGIRTIRERLVTNKQVIFEVESPEPAPEIAQKFRGFEFNGQKAEAESSDGEIRLKFSK